MSDAMGAINEVLNDADKATTDVPIDPVTHARVVAVEKKLDQVLELALRCETVITAVVKEVKPTLDSLMSTPLFKMLGGKKK